MSGSACSPMLIRGSLRSGVGEAVAAVVPMTLTLSNK